jgi:hypothetical protein
MSGLPFEFEVPVTFYENESLEKGKARRIGGIISTENPDRQNEVVLQSGLDFSSFLRSGWYNDNHSRDTDGVIGYPEMVKTFKRGDMLPDGSLAPTSGTWAEGYMLNTKRADRIWELGKALQGTGRHLGFSVEGAVQKRIGRNRRTIAKALVRNVAITNCPVNTDSRLDILAKSLMAVETAEPTDLEKALGMGTTGGVLAHPAGPQSGATAGQVLATESLETDKRTDLTKRLVDEDDDEAKKSLSDAEAVAWVQSRMPGISAAYAGRIVDLTRRLKSQGRL